MPYSAQGQPFRHDSVYTLPEIIASHECPLCRQNFGRMPENGCRTFTVNSTKECRAFFNLQRHPNTIDSPEWAFPANDPASIAAVELLLRKYASSNLHLFGGRQKLTNARGTTTSTGASFTPTVRVGHDMALTNEVETLPLVEVQPEMAFKEISGTDFSQLFVLDTDKSHENEYLLDHWRCFKFDLSTGGVGFIITQRRLAPDHKCHVLVYQLGR